MTKDTDRKLQQQAPADQKAASRQQNEQGDAQGKKKHAARVDTHSRNSMNQGSHTGAISPGVTQGADTKVDET